MSIWNSNAVRALVLIVSTVGLQAQDAAPDLQSSIKFDLPSDSPLTLLSSSMGASRATPRGGAMVIDLHMSVTLKNSGMKRVRGLMLLVTAQEVAPGGKGSVAKPSLDILPGQTVTIPIDLRLVRPLQTAGGPLVNVSLDGILFEDLNFAGPNRLNSRRMLTFWEMEAQRDRKYLKQILQSRGEGALRDEMVASIGRMSEQPQMEVRLARNGRAVTGQAATVPDKMVQFAFLSMPGAPVEAVRGWADVAGNEARSPQIEVLNRSKQTVRYVEIGWLVRDKDGRDLPAGSVPTSENALLIGSGQKATLLQDKSLEFSRSGKPVAIQGMTGFVRQVEFANGAVWVPSKADLIASPVLRGMTPSPEEQRLADLYSKKGLAGLVADLNRY